MSRQGNFFDTTDATFLRGSGDGTMPSGLPGGLPASRYGQGVAPASLSPRQAREAGVLTSGIYGQPGTGSSRSASLQSSLESRLRARMGSGGSTLFLLTWRQRVTPAGRLICALRAVGRRTSGKDFSSWRLVGWQTPKLPSGGGQAVRNTKGGGLRKLEDQAQLASWPTPMVNDLTGSTHCYGKNREKLLKLPGAANLTLGLPPSGSPAGMAKPGQQGQLNPTFSGVFLMGFPISWDLCAPRAKDIPSGHWQARHSQESGD